MNKAPRLLFVAESITLAQVTRLVTLASSLHARGYEIHFACSSFPSFIFGNTSFRQWIIKTVEQEKVLASLKKGSRLYTEEILHQYIHEELSLFDKIKPDVVIGDFRLSLSVSAAATQIPFINLINAYWSPHALRDRFPLPEHPIVKLTGPLIASVFFPLARPFSFRHFAHPVNCLRKKYGLPAIGSLEEVLTYGDYVVYPEVPELVPLKTLPHNHFFIGPVLWSPEENESMDTLPEGKPLIYATLGSSGAVEKLCMLTEALKEVEANVMIATAGRTKMVSPATHIHLRDFLPGSALARRSALVITNGGSSTGYQALAEGAPVLGIPANIDQYLSSQAIERSGAGLILRSDTLEVKALRRKINEILANDKYRKKANLVKEAFARYDSCALFEEVVRRAVELRA